jgi:hypothetical protein
MRIFPSQIVSAKSAVPAILVSVYTGITALIFYQLAGAWPHAGNWRQLFLVLLCPAIASNVLKLIGPTVRSRARRILEGLLSIVIGVPVALSLTQFSSSLSLNTFRDNYAPFIGVLRANLPAPCAPAAAVLATPGIAEYNRATYSTRGPQVTLYYDAQRFVASLPGGSIDIDGSTIYYDSRGDEWMRFHNDDRKGRERFNALTENLEHCQLRSPAKTSRNSYWPEEALRFGSARRSRRASAYL